MGVGRYELSADVPPGLPTIRGQFGANAKAYDQEQSGAFKRLGYAANGANTEYTGAVIDFNATTSNKIFGASDTVQPPAIVMYYIMKT